MSKKLRALDLILQRGLIADEKEARACLMAGQVYSGSRRIAGASEMLPIDCELHLTRDGHALCVQRRAQAQRRDSGLWH